MDAMLHDLGGELALVLDRRTWNALGIDVETRLEIVSDADGIHIRPKSDEHRERVLDIARRMMDAHEETLRKLAR